MKNEKTANQRLHASRNLFFSIGLCIACLLTFVAFEFKVYLPEDGRVDITEDSEIVFDYEVTPTIQSPKVKIPEPIKEKEFVIKETKEKKITEPKEKVTVDAIEDLVGTLGNDGKPSEEIVEDNTLYNMGTLEFAPEFPGGLEKFYKFVADEIKYPVSERRRGIEGKVYLSFIIEKNGELTDIKVYKGVSEGLDQEAIRVLEASPEWKAGSQRGRKVRVKMIIPIYFQLK